MNFQAGTRKSLLFSYCSQSSVYGFRMFYYCYCGMKSMSWVGLNFFGFCLNLSYLVIVLRVHSTVFEFFTIVIVVWKVCHELVSIFGVFCLNLFLQLLFTIIIVVRKVCHRLVFISGAFCLNLCSLAIVLRVQSKVFFILGLSNNNCVIGFLLFLIVLDYLVHSCHCSVYSLFESLFVSFCICSIINSRSLCCSILVSLQCVFSF